MNEQPHVHNGKIYLKKHWWLESCEADKAHGIEENSEQGSNSVTNKASQHVQSTSLTGMHSNFPPTKTGPIPLALPQLISSRGRAVSSSSQFEDAFETAPESEAALSRLSSRMHSPRTVPKVSGAQDGRNETKSPLFRWKPFMVDRTAAGPKKTPASPRESSLEANAGADTLEKATATAAGQQQLRAKDLLQAANQDENPKQEHQRINADPASVAQELTSAVNSRRSTLEAHSIHHSQTSSPKRLSVLTTTSTKEDHSTVDGAALASRMKRSSDVVDQTERSCSSGDITADGDKEVAMANNDRSAEDEYGSTVTGTGMEAVSSHPQSEASQPFPLMPVEASGAASGAGSPLRGRAPSRPLHRQSVVMQDDGDGNKVRVSRSRSKAGNVRVTVEVRTPQGSPSKGNARKEGNQERNGNAERVVIVTTDVEEAEEEE
jgi:hypothetical protein